MDKYLKKSELQEQLTRLGIQFDPEAKRTDLIELLTKSMPSAQQDDDDSEWEKPDQGQPDEGEEKLTPPEDQDEKSPGDEPEKLISTGLSPRFQQKIQEDYLRKYQYRKGAEFGSVNSDPVPGSKAEKMKNFLLSQEKVRTFIPREKGEDSSIRLSVNLNGYRLDFPKQTYIDMPRQVSEVVQESLDQTEMALAKNRIEGNKEKEKALF